LSLIRGKPASSSRKHRQPSRLGRGIEILEGRLVPAQINVTTFADVVAIDGLVSLREAITRANTTEEADVISLQAGHYKISLAGQNELANATGDFNITKPLTIVGQGMASTMIDAAGLDRVFEVIGSINVRFNNLQITGGAAPDFGGGSQGLSAANGGGIQALSAANITLDKCLVIKNRALTAGGGINVPIGNVSLIDSTVAFNKTTQGEGGGIRALTASLTNSTVNANRAGTEGGGIFAGTATLTDSTVGGNTALNGGGIRAVTATLTNSTVAANRAVGTVLPGPIYTGYGAGINATSVTLTNSTVRHNHSDESGGGILAWAGVGGFATLTNSTVYGNSAGGDGGGIWTNTVTATNSTVSGNRAHGLAGGIFASGGTLLNATITRNSAYHAGGVYGGTFYGGVSVKNTIIAQNRNIDTGFNGYLAPGGPDVGGNFISLGHNLIGLKNGSTGFGAAGDQVGFWGFALNPRLGPLANNGGPTLTHALLSGSRAINAGDNNGAPATDQRGVVRRQVDIGAFEVFQAIVSVDSGLTFQQVS
jgi:hypothetical protein